MPRAPRGALTYYVDGVGNRTYEISTGGSTTSTRVTGYPATCNRMALVTTDRTVTRTFGHDFAGKLTTDTKEGTTWATTAPGGWRRHAVLHRGRADA